MVLSTIEGWIPTMIGTGAVIYSFNVDGKMGIKTCSHLNGKTKDRNAYIAYPKIVFDWDMKIIFFSSKTASKILMMECNGRNLKTQYIDLS